MWAVATEERKRETYIPTEMGTDRQTDRERETERARETKRDKDREYYKYVFILVCEIIIMCNSNPHRP